MRMTAMAVVAVGAAVYVYTQDKSLGIAFAGLALGVAVVVESAYLVTMAIWRNTPAYRRRAERLREEAHLAEFKATATQAEDVAAEFDKCVRCPDVARFRRAVRRMHKLNGKLIELDVLNMPIVTTDSDDANRITDLAAANRDVLLKAAYLMHDGDLGLAKRATEASWTRGL